MRDDFLSLVITSFGRDGVVSLQVLTSVHNVLEFVLEYILGSVLLQQKNPGHSGDRVLAVSI